MTPHLTPTDYKNIADAVYGLGDTESTEQVIEYKNGDCLLIVQVNHKIKHRNEIGGSYENYDFEMLTVVYEESFDVLDAACYDSDGNEVECDFNPNELLKYLN